VMKSPPAGETRLPACVVECNSVSVLYCLFYPGLYSRKDNPF
jgi:hypothetical protein